VSERVQHSVMADTKELKERLWKLVKTIVDSDDDYSLQTTDDAIAALSSLRDFKINNNKNGTTKTTKSFSDKLDHFAPPPHFRCPISSQLMIDPVILSTGQVPLFPILFLFFIYITVITITET
jgi:hypothetical protein